MLEQPGLPCDQEHSLDREVVLGENPVGNRAVVCRARRYSTAMNRSVFARLISALSMSTRSSGHSRYATRTSSTSAAASALPMPYQAGRLSRICDHAKTHGMARSNSSVGVATAMRGSRTEMQSRELSHRCDLGEVRGEAVDVRQLRVRAERRRVQCVCELGKTRLPLVQSAHGRQEPTPGALPT